ncbi:LD-carboxypeptidase [Olivibacter sp. SDN3]|uniref:S66 peptidase family protein n=1 Tax=Olivibacter sp. SDN3 TaxID=2764720 RepID=UPI0016518F4F|nr:LD-carboxypeptidase [Olivibacter sp. SDN3]QNL48325.1 LD-carboxypeptidase [Olivibacter sp. SDN3]
MNKRTFLRTLGTGLASAAFLTGKNDGFARDFPVSTKLPLIYPPKLQKGDTIGIISPSSAIVGNLPFQLAQETFEALGFRVKWGKFTQSRLGHLAGSDEGKLEDIHQMFADREVKAIVCMRGGSGAARLLDKLDYPLIKKNPKVFLGYSDITALHAAIHSQTGLITFHGPVGTSSWPSFVVEQFETLFFQGGMPHYENPLLKKDDLIPRENRIQTINPGKVSGKLLGGNLTVLTGISGSKYFPDFENTILFLEDVAEEPYRIERMLCQLKLNGTLDQIKGFIFGKCTNCSPSGGYGSLTLDEILDDYIRPLNVPAYQGALIGHISEQFILPVGAPIRLNADNGTFSVATNIFGPSMVK